LDKPFVEKETQETKIGFRAKDDEKWGIQEKQKILLILGYLYCQTCLKFS